MTTTASISGRIVLAVAHCAGMLDLVALPVWVGALMEFYQFDPQQAGGLATIFLFGAVAASLLMASRLHLVMGNGKSLGRWLTAVGFAAAAAAFFSVTLTQNYMYMAICHGLAGLAVGAALSVTHGTIARSEHPHRIFAIVGAALGVFSIVFLGATPVLIAKMGGDTLFSVFALVMLVAALACVLAFPQVEQADKSEANVVQQPYKMPSVVWFGIVGICVMGLVQAMTFSFLERVGVANNFSLELITGVLIALGFVNLIPAPLAAFLENRISAKWVLVVGPSLQALLCFVIMTSSAFLFYGMAASVFAAVMIFTHTFAFGVIAKLDVSGRALAATPAMLMTGAGIGPILGGSLVKAFGYPSIGVTALVISLIATLCFAKVFSEKAVGAMKESVV